METNTGSVLADYIDRATLAQQLRCTERSIARYENEPNGLPWLMVGGRKFYRISAVQAWLTKREHNPNPRRRTAA